jgi:hypothetical protein
MPPFDRAAVQKRLEQWGHDTACACLSRGGDCDCYKADLAAALAHIAVLHKKTVSMNDWIITLQAKCAALAQQLATAQQAAYDRGLALAKAQQAIDSLAQPLPDHLRVVPSEASDASGAGVPEAVVDKVEEE